MSKPSFTSGPWEVYDQGLDDGPEYGCAIKSTTDEDADWIATDIQNRADAHLIAAAPALYWACVRAEERWLPCSHSPACNIEADDMDELCEDCDDRRMLREAIKQARGEP